LNHRHESVSAQVCGRGDSARTPHQHDGQQEGVVASEYGKSGRRSSEHGKGLDVDAADGLFEANDVVALGQLE